MSKNFSIYFPNYVLGFSSLLCRYSSALDPALVVALCLIHRREDFLITGGMLSHILSGAAYQFSVLLLLITTAHSWVPEKKWNVVTEEQRLRLHFCEFNTCPATDTLNPGGSDGTIRSGHRYLPFSNSESYLDAWNDEIGPSRHATLIFNVFVLMQVFNMISSRVLDSPRTPVYKNLSKNKLFLGIWISILVAQIAIVEWGGRFMSCTSEGLTIVQWAISFCFGVGQLIFSSFCKQCLHGLTWPQVGGDSADIVTVDQAFSLSIRGRTSKRMRRRLCARDANLGGLIAAKKFARRARLQTISKCKGKNNKLALTIDE
eukprot:GHVT01088341.1.p1 GENE.GHVT01088341.1~~GHVT01088341.1.p1  ORF type:complete len:317 (+),score=26.88 GHVT01088341.1:39-989(+)